MIWAGPITLMRHLIRNPRRTPVWILSGQTVCLNQKADDSVPRGIIRFQVTYNAAAVRPYVEYSEGSYVGIGSYDISDDFERFMRNKDLFLKDLKARQLHSYKSAGITQIKVLVHPEDRDMLRLP